MAVGLVINHFRSEITPLVRRPVVILALAIAAAASAVAAFKCQFRAQIPCVAIGLALVLFRSRLALKLVAFGGLTAMVIVPSLFMTDVGHEVLDLVGLEGMLTAIGSSSAGASDLSERTLLYEYGWANLQKPAVLLFGEGPMLRDAQGALGETGRYSAEYRMPYHSAFLDFIMHSGAIIGPLVVIGLFSIVGLAFRSLSDLNPLDTERKQNLVFGLINLVLWLSLSVIDSGLSNPETIWLAIAPLFGALAGAGRHSAAEASRVRLALPPQPAPLLA